MLVVGVLGEIPSPLSSGVWRGGRPDPRRSPSSAPHPDVALVWGSEQGGGRVSCV